jgi:CheY-like chemotaxis protein
MPECVPPLLRILYVEDEPDIREVAKLALEAIGGFALEVCASGEAALAKAPQWRPDLVLLDVMMPNMDGRATLKALRVIEGLGEVPVVFFTAKQGAEVDELIELGAAGVLAKPFDPMTLAEKVSEIWARHHGRPS